MVELVTHYKVDKCVHHMVALGGRGGQTKVPGKYSFIELVPFVTSNMLA